MPSALEGQAFLKRKMNHLSPLNTYWIPRALEGQAAKNKPFIPQIHIGYQVLLRVKQQKMNHLSPQIHNIGYQVL